jgi:serine/threonine protein kinase
LLTHSFTDAYYAPALLRLRRLCRNSGLAPTSCKLSKEVQMLTSVPISSSHFSDIYRGRLDGHEVAVKALRLHMDDIQSVKKVSSPCPLQGYTDAEEAYLHELVLWQCLRHENIVPFIGTCSSFEVSLVSEWMSGGTITAYLLRNPEGDRATFVCSSVRYHVNKMLICMSTGQRRASWTYLHAFA